MFYLFSLLNEAKFSYTLLYLLEAAHFSVRTLRELHPNITVFASLMIDLYSNMSVCDDLNELSFIYLRDRLSKHMQCHLLSHLESLFSQD